MFGGLKEKCYLCIARNRISDTDMKTFNIAGKCIPSLHYMADISHQVGCAVSMLRDGQYFCINRGRQYGKTTTLAQIEAEVQNEYSVFSISFESYGDSEFSSIERACSVLIRAMFNTTIFSDQSGITEECRALLKETSREKMIDVEDFKVLIGLLCQKNTRPIVLIVDEVDKAGNYPAFVHLLSILRDLYLQRDRRPTFHCVILAGVYDIKNLKLKLRPDEMHQYNSPWNIAMPYDADMSLSVSGVAGMLREYAAEHGLTIEIERTSKDIIDYTSGYPFLVSRMCMLMDEAKDWSHEGLLSAVRSILTEQNTLFDDMNKKLGDYPRLRRMLYQILFAGEDIPFNQDMQDIDIARMFSFIRNDSGKLRIINRLFETRLYNLFISEEKENEQAYDRASAEKPVFFVGSQLNMRKVLERFCVLYANLYTSRDERFDENEGRKKFLFFIKPIINGTGNYYTESTTRNQRRTDLIIDYLGVQSIVEMKIWHGQKYNAEGEQQLLDYLDAHELSVGYMLTFNFNKKKKSGITEKVFGDKTIVEAVV